MIHKRQLALMRPGAVIVDVAIDQGGCFETSRPTTHHDPTFEVDGIVHYCVTNMPGAVPVTSTNALANATLPVRARAGRARRRRGDRARTPACASASTSRAAVPTHPAVARSVGQDCVDVEAALAAAAG